MPGPRSSSSAAAQGPSRDFYVIGIGTSAGGLGALRTLFSQMPATPGVACVVVVHLAPGHPSQLAPLLQPYTTMPVQQVTRTVALEPNRVYVIPPNANLDAIDTHLRLTALEAHRGQRAPIDHFLRTLATTHDGNAVGVVLTGAGSDGALGLRHIKAEGGLTAVQDPEEAEFDGMPRAALDTGLVDVVAPLRELPDRILAFCRTRPQLPGADGDGLPDGDAATVDAIVGELSRQTGQDVSVYRRPSLLRRIRHRMQLHGLTTAGQYLERVREAPDEAYALLFALQMSVVDFFREPAFFETLERVVVTGLLDQAAPRQRAWVIGCSTGELVYSLAMLLVEAAEQRGQSPVIQLIASDTSKAAIDRARHGVYPREIARTVSPERLRRFFEHGRGYYRVGRLLRDLVVFTEHDPFGDPPFTHQDLILSPNLLGELRPEARTRLLDLLHYALEPTGMLVVGPDDLPTTPPTFVPVPGTTTAFRPIPQIRPPWALPFRARSLPPTPRPGPVPPPRLDAGLYANVHRRMLDEVGPASVLVDAANTLVHASGPVEPFLRLPGGELTYDVVEMAREPLRSPLAHGLEVVRHTAAPWVSDTVAVAGDGGIDRVQVRIWPAGAAGGEGLHLVVFAPVAAGRPVDRLADPGPAIRRIGRLDDLLRRAIATLHGHARATGDGAARPGGADALRTTLDELQTALADLHVVGDELQTLDRSVRRRIGTLARSSDELQRLLQSTGIATLFLDAERRIQRFTPQVGSVFELDEQDVGRRLAETVHRLHYPELDADVARVQKHRAPLEREVDADGGRWYLVRLQPYAVDAGAADGVAMTLLDVTDRRRANDELRAADRRKDRFLALLAHELRNPLAPIVSGIELLQLKGAEPSAAVQIVPIIRRQVRQLVRMVDDLLEVSRISGGRLRLRRQAVRVAEIVDEAAAAIRPLVEQARQELVLAVEDTGEPIDADGARLVQVLTNLLNNASRYTPPGGRITLTAQRRAGDAVWAVRDTGRGMSDEVLRQAFTMFFRGQEGAQAAGGGLGIGLAIARELVEMHGGTLTATSGGADAGSTFEMRIPASDAAAREVADGAPEAPAPSPGRRRVLVVDDNRDAAEALRLQLRAMGLRDVQTAISGPDALRAGPAFQPDIVLLDLGMPGMDGFELARRIREAPWGQRLTLVALTGWGQDADRQRTEGAGFDRHLVKPASMAEIESVLADA